MKRSEDLGLRIADCGLGGVVRRAAALGIAGTLALLIGSPRAAAAGQAPATQNSELRTQSSAPAEYVLGPEDQITVTILGASAYPEFAQPAVMTVRPDGKIALGRLGELTASGRSAAQLKAEIERGLQRFFKKAPAVNVAITGFRAQGMFYVLGEVKQESAFPFRKGIGALEALALAGGATLTADLKHVAVLRGDGTRLETDLSRATQRGESENNVPLQPGDVVTIPRLQPRKVTVVGGVNKPATYDFVDEIALLDALQLAGGPREKADLKGAVLTARDGTSVPVDLEEVIRNGNTALNRKINDGDTLLVPEKLIRVYVAGEVTKPDTLMLREGATLLEAFTECGWFTKDADLKQVRLGRKGAGGELQPQTLDLRDLREKMTLAQNVPLKDGDLIVVLSRSKKKGLGDYLPLIYPLEALRRLLMP